VFGYAVMKFFTFCHAFFWWVKSMVGKITETINLICNQNTNAQAGKWF